MEFKQLGAVLKHCRELKGKTAKELAAELGVHRNTLSGYESGRALSDEMFVQLCVDLGVDVGEAFAAACLAKLADLRPIEDRKRAEKGLPARPRESTNVERLEELLDRCSAAFKDLERFKLEQMGPHSRQETLVRLAPDSLRDLGAGSPGRPRKRKQKEQGGDGS